MATQTDRRIFIPVEAAYGSSAYHLRLNDGPVHGSNALCGAVVSHDAAERAVPHTALCGRCRGTARRIVR